MKHQGMAVAGLMLLGSGAQAAGFSLIEQNASGLGNAYAGQAASAQDASVLFFNPAGLTEIQGRQVVAAVHLIKPSAQYSTSAGAEDGGDAGGLIPVPSAYYAMDINPDLKFGIGMGTPFGLKTEYDSDWVGRSQAILSDLQSISLSPTLAWRLNDAVSLGVGVNYSYIQAELSKGLPYPYSLSFPTVVTTMKGEDTAWSYNLGAMFHLGPDTRLGLGYRSTVKYHLSGSVTSNVDPALAQLGIPADVYADVKLPDIASLAIHHQINDRWSVMADATWTGWGVFDRLDIRRQSDGALVDRTDESWKDVWRFGLGASYRMNGTWTWRFGVAYDNAPVPDSAHRTPRIPDADRTWLAMGGQYALSDKGKVDFGYAHLFVKDSNIDNPPGSYDNAVDILSVQYSHTF